jgi:ferredoxin
MCELCQKYSTAGVKWYFNPENYRRELGLTMKDTFKELHQKKGVKWLAENAEKSDTLLRMPAIGGIFSQYYNEKIGEIGTQAAPLDDVLRILDLGEDFCVVPCPCRMLSGVEEYTCFHFGITKTFFNELVPDGQNLRELTKEEAKSKLIEWDQAGYFHLIVPLVMPYIFNICNCAVPYCWAWRARMIHKAPKMLTKGEYVALVDPDLCTGCGACATRCAFGAIAFNNVKNVSFINIASCFGCGLCKTVCEEGAVRLIDRQETPVGHLW